MKVIGIDVGGTKIAAGLVDLDDGAILARYDRPTSAERGGEAIFNDVYTLAAMMWLDAKAIGLGVPELVSRDGKIVSNTTLGWMNFDVRERLEKLVPAIPTRLEADVRAAARAEARFGAGVGAEIFLFVTVGTGISCCLVNHGQPYLGAQGLTGTFASARTLAPLLDDRLDPCMPLEEFSSGPGLARRYALGAKETIDAKELLARATAGDANACEIAETGGRALGAAIAQLVNTLDPERVVIGGGLGCAAGLFHDSLRESFYKHLWSELHAKIPLTQAKLGPDAGIIGAALAAIS